MAKLIVHNPPRAILKASGYTGSPEGNIELTENNKTYDVSDFATATTRIPEPPEPTGTKEIIENGVHDVKEYAFADVKVPEPSGTITLDENNRSYDVTDYAAADVAIPEEEKTVTPSTTRQEITPDNGLLSKVTVLPASLEERTVTPAIVQQEITPEAPAIGFSKVTVGAASQPTLITKQITENGTYSAEDDNADGYSEVEVDVPAPEPVEEKDVNFYDYDGTVLYSYTNDEVLELSELPPLPEQEGYIYQEWNWSLEKLKATVQSGFPVDVGAIRAPSDGNSYLYFYVPSGTNLIDMTLWLRVPKRSSVTIDWGDGTSDILTNTDIQNEQAKSATKTNFPICEEDTVWKIKITNGNFRFGYGYGNANIFGLTAGNANTPFLINAECGINCLGAVTYAFRYLSTLDTISFSNSFVNTTSKFIADCLNIRHLNLPKQISTGSVTNCTSIKNIVFPEEYNAFGYEEFLSNTSLRIQKLLTKAVTQFGYRCFEYCYSTIKIVIPSSMTSIGERAFQHDYRLKYIDLSDYSDPTTVPALANTNAFNYINPDAIFQFRNQSMLDAFAGATNWSTFAAQFVIGGKFAEVTP